MKPSIDSNQGQLIVEMVFATILLSAALIGFMATARLINRRLSLQEGLRFISCISVAVPQQETRSQIWLAQEWATVRVHFRRFDDTAAARFYHLNQITLTTDLPFSLKSRASVVLQSPQQEE